MCPNDLAPNCIECGNRRAEADGDPLAQELVESAVADRHAGPYRSPRSAHVHTEQHLPG